MSKTLKQVIIMNSENHNHQHKSLCLAKAAMSLVTRCFEGASGYIGRHENKAFNAVIIDWVDNYQQETQLLSATSDEIDCYFWTAEMEGIPSKHIEHDGVLGCMVIGPAESEILDAFLLGVDPY